LDCETPVIAKVRGPAYGMGVNIALAGDFVIAADDARLCDSHVKNGVTAGDGGSAPHPADDRLPAGEGDAHAG
jgi:enoyl-CoA hydratase